LLFFYDVFIKDIGVTFVNLKFFLNETFLTECVALTLPILFVFSVIFYDSNNCSFLISRVLELPSVTVSVLSIAFYINL
jgi:hypothetical protein